MQRFYSQTTGATYFKEVHGSVPSDAVPISEDRFKEVIINPARGKLRVHDDDGLPILIDPPAATVEELAAAERQWRDGELSAIMWLRERHRDQQEIGGETTITAEQFGALLVYMQALRDWPQSLEFPDSQYRPLPPTWLVGIE